MKFWLNLVTLALATGFGPLSAQVEPAPAFGAVKVDARARTISFPARVNMRGGPIEYFVVHESGKIHESLFKTSVKPEEIHVAALLLAERGADPAQPEFKAPVIFALWKANGTLKGVRAEELIRDKKRARALGKTRWAYRGSRVVNGVFLAQRDGSIIAVMEDRDALIDQNTPEASDDDNWEAMTEAMPEVGTDVTIRISFAGEKE